ncbi:MAG: hypothetical protein SWK90_01115 [Chloroflexota bacterium]|nr:hypothetical protein [Chloroflexota bacterium]
MSGQQEYAVTVHGMDEILDGVSGLSIEVVPPMVYCDSQGECLFDAAPNPYVGAIVEIFNARGEQGWILVQVVPREQDMICFWRRERSTE